MGFVLKGAMKAGVGGGQERRDRVACWAGIEHSRR